MSLSSMLTSMIRSLPQLAQMSFSLFYLYLSLGKRVRKARRAFEKELILQGMSKKDAEQLSTCFEELKNNITYALKQGVTHPLRE